MRSPWAEAGGPWRAGMRGVSEELARAGYRDLICLDDEGHLWASGDRCGTWDAERFGIIPVGTDAASVGAMLGCVRERLGPTFYLRPVQGGGWAAGDAYGPIVGLLGQVFATEEEALARAWAARPSP